MERDALCETTALEQERCAAKELDEAATMALGEVERLSGEVERLSQELLVAKQTSEQNRGWPRKKRGRRTHAKKERTKGEKRADGPTRRKQRNKTAVWVLARRSLERRRPYGAVTDG